MAITRPDEYKHENENNYSIVDAKNVRGGCVKFNTLVDRDNYPIDKRGNMICYVEGYNYRYTSDDFSDVAWQDVNNWLKLENKKANLATKNDLITFIDAEEGDIVYVLSEKTHYRLLDPDYTLFANWRKIEDIETSPVIIKVASQPSLLSTEVEVGDLVYVIDEQEHYKLVATDYTDLANWVNIVTVTASERDKLIGLETSVHVTSANSPYAITDADLGKTIYFKENNVVANIPTMLAEGFKCNISAKTGVTGSSLTAANGLGLENGTVTSSYSKLVENEGTLHLSIEDLKICTRG